MDAYPRSGSVYGVGLTSRGVVNAFHEYYVYGLGFRWRINRAPATLCEFCGAEIPGNAVEDVLFTSKIALVFYRCPRCRRLIARYTPAPVRVDDAEHEVRRLILEGTVGVEGWHSQHVLVAAETRFATLAGVPALFIRLHPPGAGVFLPKKYLEWLEAGWRIEYVDPYNSYISIDRDTGKIVVETRLRDQYPLNLPNPYVSPVVFAHVIRVELDVERDAIDYLLFLSSSTIS